MPWTNPEIQYTLAPMMAIKINNEPASESLCTAIYQYHFPVSGEGRALWLKEVADRLDILILLAVLACKVSKLSQEEHADL